MITYKKASLEELEVMLKLRLEFLKQSGFIRNLKEREILEESNRTFLKSGTEKGSLIQWLAFNGEKSIGCTYLCLYELPPLMERPNGRVGYIGNVFVCSEYRSQGIGRKLVELTMESAKEAGCCQVELYAMEMGAPIYESMGFSYSDDHMKINLKMPSD